MAAHPHSVTVICPDAAKSALLALGAALGIDGGLSVPLSASGALPASHWGAHSWATETFAGIMSGDIVPTIAGVSAEQIAETLALVTVNIVRDAAFAGDFAVRTHFDSVLASAGLQNIESAQ